MSFDMWVYYTPDDRSVDLREVIECAGGDNDETIRSTGSGYDLDRGLADVSFSYDSARERRNARRRIQRAMRGRRVQIENR